MKRCQVRRTVARCRALALFALGWLTFTSSARAAADFIILGEGNAFWTNNLNSPVAKELTRLQAHHKFHSVSFTTHGDWVLLPQGPGYFTNNPKLLACKTLADLQKEKNNVKCAAFAPDGGWTVLWGQNGNWTEGGVPQEAFDQLQEVIKSGGSPSSIAFGPHGAWVVLFDQTGIRCGSIPDGLAKVFDEVRKRELTVRCVCFTTSGTWFCLTDGGWWTSDLNHPASKMIAELDSQHHSLHWVAVAPEFRPHDFKKWEAVVHRQCDGKLPGGYAFAVLHQGKVVAEGAKGWARAPWEKEHPSVKWTLEKPMGVASVSKAVTAVAMLKLWDEKKHEFSLDGVFWPHIKAICPRAHADVKRVTIRQLLQHKSGFKKSDDFTTPKDLEKLLTEPLAHKPGTHYEYDNNNFYIARLVLEKIGNTRYTAYVKEHVLKPMGITRMETHFEAHQPTCGYGKPGSKRPGYPFDWQCAETAGAAGWYGSIRDLSRFLTGLRNHKVLSPATTKMMYDDLLGWDTSEPGWEKNGGWFWDEGSAPGSRAGAMLSSIYHFPDDVDAVMFINSDATKPPEVILHEAWNESMEP